MTDNKNSNSTSLQTDAAADPHIAECLITNAEKARFHTQKLLYYRNLLIEQCDSWLSEEEGRRNQLKIKN
jgi:hypothetical protein